MSGKANSFVSILFALGANVAIFLAKLVAALYTGSGSMLAESIHSLADSGNQLLLIIGIKRAKRLPDDEHPLGYGKSIYFWSFIVALILFSMGGMFSVYEGIHKISHPQPLTSTWVAILVLIFSVGAESVSLWGCLREINKTRGRKNLFRWFRESRESELLVVLGEDIAALLGLVFALCALVATHIFENPLYDAVGSIVIGLLLIIIAVMIGIETKSLLIGQGVEPETHKRILSFLEEQPEIKLIYSLKTLQLGTDVMAAIKARMQDYISAEELIEAINKCEKRLKKKFPQIVWSFFEPDIRD